MYAHMVTNNCFIYLFNVRKVIVHIYDTIIKYYNYNKLKQ